MTAAANPPPVRLIAAYAAVYLIWGSTYLVTRYAIETVPPFLMSGARYLFAGVVLHQWCLLRGAVRPTPRQWRDCGWSGTLMLSCGTGGIAWAEQHVPSSLAALIVAMVPVWMVLFTWRQTRPGFGIAGGLVLGIIGVCLLVMNGRGYENEPLNPVGVGVALLSTLFWTVGSLFNRGADKPVDGLLAAGIQMGVAGAVMLGFGFAKGEHVGFEIRDVSAASVWAWIYLVVFGSLITFPAYIWLLQVSTPARVTTYAFVNPLIAVALGCTIGSEPFSLKLLFCTALIVLGVWLIISHPVRPRTEEISARPPQPAPETG